MPDLDDKIAAIDTAMAQAGFRDKNGTAAYPPAFYQAILGSESSAEIVHYLGSHPEECIQYARDFQDLPVSAATGVRRLLERSIERPSSAAERTTGPAAAVVPRPLPNPIVPVRSAAPATTGGPPGDDATAAEHAAYYDRMEREARRRPA
jgi:hypothetical protein